MSSYSKERVHSVADDFRLLLNKRSKSCYWHKNQKLYAEWHFNIHTYVKKHQKELGSLSKHLLPCLNILPSNLAAFIYDHCYGNFGGRKEIQIFALISWFSDKYGIINDCVFIYSPHSLHISAGNCGMFGQCYNYVKGSNWAEGFSFTIKTQVFNFVIIPNNGITKRISIECLT